MIREMMVGRKSSKEQEIVTDGKGEELGTGERNMRTLTSSAAAVAGAAR